MSSELTSRIELRSETQQYHEAQLFCSSLSISATRSLNDISTLPPSAENEAPSGKPEDKRLAIAFQQAMQILSMPEWSGFVNDSVRTVTNEPLTFGKAVKDGIYRHIREEIEVLCDLGKGFIKWLGEIASCIRDVKIKAFDPDEVLASKACEPFHDTATLIIKLEDMIAELEALGLMGILEILLQCLDYVTEILSEVLITVLTALGERAAPIKAWLEETAQSALRIGELIGILLGNILIELGTSGVGRAIKSTRMLNKLADIDVIPLTDSRNNGLRNIVQPQGILQNLSGTKRRELEELIEIFQKILNKNGKKFSRNLTIAKLRILKKHLSPELFKKFIANRKAFERYVIASAKRETGKVGPYKFIEVEGRQISRQALGFYYTDHLLGDSLPDDFEILSGKYAVLPYIFEANHIVEKRIFYARNNKEKFWGKEFAKLGWNTEEGLKK